MVPSQGYSDFQDDGGDDDDDDAYNQTGSGAIKITAIVMISLKTCKLLP